MRLTISQNSLLKLLSSVSHYGTTKTTLDILRFCLLKAEDGKISISATNLETETTVSEVATIEAEGQILVPIQRIYDLCKSLPEINIKLVASENYKLKLNWGNSATIAILDTEDFPVITNFDEDNDNIICVSTESLKEVLPQVTFAAATDESRPTLVGVYLTNGMFQSTDGFRASSIKFDALEGDIIIPAMALDRFCKLLRGKEVKIQNSGSKIIFKLENETVFTSNSIAGDFPDIEQLISSKIDLKLTFDTNQLLSVLKQAEVFADDKIGFLTVTASKNGFDIKVQSENDEFEATIPATKADGNSKIEFGISLKYLSSNKEGVLPRINSEFVEVCLGDNKGSPIILKSGNLTHLIMPMEIRKRG